MNVKQRRQDKIKIKYSYMYYVSNARESLCMFLWRWLSHIPASTHMLLLGIMYEMFLISFPPNNNFLVQIYFELMFWAVLFHFIYWLPFTSSSCWVFPTVLPKSVQWYLDWELAVSSLWLEVSHWDSHMTWQIFS